MEAVVQRLAQVDADMRQQGVVDEAPLIAWGFDPIYFGGERMTVDHLDRASATRSIIITHANGHLMNVNRVALHSCGIDRENEVEGVVKFPEGAHMGEPTGELQEPAAMFLVLRKFGDGGLLAPMSEAGVRSFASLACMQGVTTATDLVNALGEVDCAVLEKVLADDNCSIRIVPAFKAFHGSHGAGLHIHTHTNGDEASLVAIDAIGRVPLGPLFTARCAVNRITPKGRTLGAHERFSVRQALHAITLGPAYTLKFDHEIGSIECGKRADFCVMEDDPLAVEPAVLKDVRVWGTVLSGRVFEARKA